MGWPKYLEDDIEIMEDRLCMMQAERMVTVKTVVNVTIPPATSAPRSESNPILLTRICKCCGEEFPIKRKTAVWYLEHELQFPKRCRKCLNERKKAQQTKGEGI